MITSEAIASEAIVSEAIDTVDPGEWINNHL